MSVAEGFITLDAAWATSALDRPVEAVTLEPLAFTGATTDMARVRVTYASDGDGPPTLIAKLRGRKDYQVQMDQAMGLYDRESRFYAEVAERVPVRAPQCFAIGDGDTTPLLLEDLGALRMGDQMHGMALADAQATMDALGDLHAAFWESDVLGSEWLAAPAEGIYAGMISQLVASGAPAVAERFAGVVGDGIISAVVDTAPNWGTVLERCADGPQTLIHNDVRLDNLFFAGDGAPVFIDWQVVAKSRGTQDVGNLLAGSMDADDLNLHWEKLVGQYHSRLVAGGVTGYSLDECVDHYRVNVLYPLGAGMALVGQMDIGDGRGLGDRIIERCLRHIEAVDSFGALRAR